MATKKVMAVFGTRPEAIKMAPLIAALQRRTGIEVLVTVTAQHRRMLDQVLDLFCITPDDDLDVMQADQSLPQLLARLHTRMYETITRRAPDLVLVHGDTSTTLAAALAAFYARVPVGHVEAGLRTGDMTSPWPEEMNRRLTAPLARLHFAPTERARSNLLLEQIADHTVFVTGNTIVDALLDVTQRLHSQPELKCALAKRFPFLDPAKQLVLVTGHRRENFGKGFRDVCLALRRIALRGDVQVVYPLHLNPNVQEPANRILQGCPNLFLMEPLDYLPFVYLMTRASVVITDSGGIQEEAPSLGKPVLVTRRSTERPEAVDAGTVRVVGTDTETICTEAFRLLDDNVAYEIMAQATNPFGDGKASERIAQIISEALI